MTGFDLILWRRGLNWTQERAAAELGISRTSLVKYEDGETVPRTIQLATVALTLKANGPPENHEQRQAAAAAEV